MKQLLIVSDGQSTKEVIADPLRLPIFENISKAPGNLLVSFGTRAYDFLMAAGYPPKVHCPTTRGAAVKQKDGPAEIMHTSNGPHSGVVELVELLEAKYGAFDQVICMGFDGAKIVKHPDNAKLGTKLTWTHDPTRKNTGPVASPGKLDGHGMSPPQ